MNLSLPHVATQTIMDQLKESGQKTLSLLSHNNIRLVYNNLQLADLASNSHSTKFVKCHLSYLNDHYTVTIKFTRESLFPFIRENYTLSEVDAEVCNDWSCEILNMIIGDLIGYFANVHSIKIIGVIPTIVSDNDLRNNVLYDYLGCFQFDENNKINTSDQFFKIEIFKSR